VTAAADSRALAVVGTDTGIGKTVVTAALVARAREAGTEAVAIKPAQTGFPEDDDAGVVQWACETEAAATRLRAREEPLAPAVAARRAGDPIVYESLLDDTRAVINDPDTDIGVVEGAGGLRVPLSNEPDREIVDLVADLGVPALVVARSGLGTLNHTALTVEALRKREIPVAGVALNRYDGETVAARTNPGELERMCDCPVWTLPEADLETPGDLRALGEELPSLSELAG
jgi:dethiobiotin synthetase